jgi:23S rRNA pseudouridine1911/1915/1917 synthase
MIIYEDKNIIVVNKPAGIAVHPDATHKSGTLIQEILKTHSEIKNVGDPSIGSGQANPFRPGIVHRLDKDTSGVLIIAKNQETFEFLKKQFQERKVKKTYICLVVGELKNKKGVINLPIGRSKKSPLQRLASLKARGKLREAITEYKVLETFSETRFQNSPKPGFGFTLVEAYPKTGRTHQIRAHFKAIGHSIVCDKLYSKNPVCPFGLSRHFLHAFSLELTLPNGSRNRFEADLPEDLEKALGELRKISKYDTT